MCRFGVMVIDSLFCDLYMWPPRATLLSKLSCFSREAKSDCYSQYLATFSVVCLFIRLPPNVDENMEPIYSASEDGCKHSKHHGTKCTRCR